MISGNTFAGIEIKGGGMFNAVQGNYIGTDASGTDALGNRSGVVVASTSNTIGGTEPGARNVISGNTDEGVSMDAVFGEGSSNMVQGNYIGTDATGSTAVANGSGIEISGMHENLIGGSQPGARNVISGNSFAGIEIRTAGCLTPCRATTSARMRRGPPPFTTAQACRLISLLTTSSAGRRRVLVI